MLFQIVNIIFTVYTLMLMVRIIGSWFPKIASSRFMRMIAFYTDPYLNLFRKIIPPIGGMIDVSPMLAFLALQFLQFFIMRYLLKYAL